jgi:diguanylate cyclase (GGDEF) domain
MINVRSITFRIVALGIALAGVGILVRQFVALPLVQQHVQELAATQQLATASYVARDVDYAITSRLALIERYAADLPVALINRPTAFAAWIRERERMNPSFSGGLLAVRPNGRGLLAEYPAVGGRWKQDYAAADWLLAAVRGSKPVIGKSSRDPVSGKPAIVFAAPVRDAKGRVVTVLAGLALLDSPQFLDGVRETRLGQTGGLLVVSPSDRLFVMSTDPEMILKPTPAPGVNVLHDRAMAGYRGTGVTVNAEGVEELSAMVTVPSTGWFVVARMPTEEAFRTVTVLRNFAYKVSGGLLAIIVAILLLALPRILRPLTDAARAMRDMAEGRRKIEALPIVRDDEVGKLVSGFNFLVERLHKEEAARVETEARLKFLAHHDALTGLCNRAMLEDRLKHALASAERDGSQIALLFCDLDEFKAVNDQHGHDVGDAVLREVATRLADGRRRADTVARLGGDEFVILMTGLEDAYAAASVVARQCLAAVSEPYVVDGKSATLGMSIGIALHAGPAVAPSYLLAQADVAMYQVKRKGKQDFFFMHDIFKGDRLERVQSARTA